MGRVPLVRLRCTALEVEMDKVKNRTIKRIKGALHEEREAIKDYRKDAKKVDPKTAKLMREIARDEMTHKRQLAKRLGVVTKR